MTIPGLLQESMRYKDKVYRTTEVDEQMHWWYCLCICLLEAVTDDHSVSNDLRSIIILALRDSPPRVDAPSVTGSYSEHDTDTKDVEAAAK